MQLQQFVYSVLILSILFLFQSVTVTASKISEPKIVKSGKFGFGGMKHVPIPKTDDERKAHPGLKRLWIRLKPVLPNDTDEKKITSLRSNIVTKDSSVTFVAKEVGKDTGVYTPIAHAYVYLDYLHTLFEEKSVDESKRIYKNVDDLVQLIAESAACVTDNVTADRLKEIAYYLFTIYSPTDTKIDRKEHLYKSINFKINQYAKSVMATKKTAMEYIKDKKENKMDRELKTLVLGVKNTIKEAKERKEREQKEAKKAEEAEEKKKREEEEKKLKEAGEAKKLEEEKKLGEVEEEEEEKKLKEAEDAEEEKEKERKDPKTKEKIVEEETETETETETKKKKEDDKKDDKKDPSTGGGDSKDVSDKSGVKKDSSVKELKKKLEEKHKSTGSGSEKKDVKSTGSKSGPASTKDKKDKETSSTHGKSGKDEEKVEDAKDKKQTEPQGTKETKPEETGKKDKKESKVSTHSQSTEPEREGGEGTQGGEGKGEQREGEENLTKDDTGEKLKKGSSRVIQGKGKLNKGSKETTAITADADNKQDDGKMSMGKILLIVAVVLVLLGMGGGFAAWSFFGSKDSKTLPSMEEGDVLAFEKHLPIETVDSV